MQLLIECLLCPLGNTLPPPGAGRVCKYSLETATTLTTLHGDAMTSEESSHILHRFGLPTLEADKAIKAVLCQKQSWRV
ncbi:hypothetical protein [Leptolyngbya sp. FACHB-321]|uniref:hypothetical protein n=1 Tax=Leptolyngbya sp. FACHB-321 TaxID=2692807 RepID=UPI0018F054A5|nr:hypothetical protein [Leptolyngbya sp. FACHB-321]